jgi:hypothetical protein
MGGRAEYHTWPAAKALLCLAAGVVLRRAIHGRNGRSGWFEDLSDESEGAPPPSRMNTWTAVDSDSTTSPDVRNGLLARKRENVKCRATLYLALAFQDLFSNSFNVRLGA